MSQFFFNPVQCQWFDPNEGSQVLIISQIEVFRVPVDEVKIPLFGSLGDEAVDAPAKCDDHFFHQVNIETHQIWVFETEFFQCINIKNEYMYWRNCFDSQ